MKHKVQATFTQDEYDHLLALKNYLGFKSLSETLSFAVQKEIESHQESLVYRCYLHQARGHELKWNSFMYLPKKEPRADEEQPIENTDKIGKIDVSGREECMKKSKKLLEEEYNMRLD